MQTSLFFQTLPGPRVPATQPPLAHSVRSVYQRDCSCSFSCSTGRAVLDKRVRGAASSQAVLLWEGERAMQGHRLEWTSSFCDCTLSRKGAAPGQEAQSGTVSENRCCRHSFSLYERVSYTYAWACRDYALGGASRCACSSGEPQSAAARGRVSCRQ